MKHAGVDCKLCLVAEDFVPFVKMDVPVNAKY